MTDLLVSVMPSLGFLEFHQILRASQHTSDDKKRSCTSFKLVYLLFLIIITRVLILFPLKEQVFLPVTMLSTTTTLESKNMS